MHAYGLAEVEKLLRLPRSTIRALVAAGFVTPQRGPRRTLRFSFQDLIVLRTAQALADARVPAQRITRSLRALRRQLPETLPLSGLSIGAVGDRVVVKDGAGQRQADTGQYLLAFEGDPVRGALHVTARPAKPRAPESDAYARALAGERAGDAPAALAAYAEAVQQEPARLEVRINFGRLLHEAGQLAQAEQVYRDALRACGDDPLLLYNFGVLLDDLDRKTDAVKTYLAALRADPQLADCHYNLALLSEQLGKPRDAIRHMAQYRRLTAARGER